MPVFPPGSSLAVFSNAGARGLFCILNYFTDVAHFAGGLYASGSRLL